MEFTTKNGANVIINEVPTSEAWSLKSAMEKALLKHGININTIIESLDKQDPQEMIISAMVIDSDEDSLKAMLVCLNRCTYNLDRITMSTFDNMDARADYYEVIIALLKINILPFFRNLLSKLRVQEELIKKNQK